MEEKTYFEVGDLLGIGMTLVVLVIGLAYGLEVTGDIRSDMITQNIADDGTSAGCNATSGIYTGCSGEVNATTSGIAAIAKIPEKLGTIVTIIIAAVIIGILVRYLWVRFQ